MIGLTLKFKSISLGIVILQPFVVFFLTFQFILQMLPKRSFVFGVSELSTMFVMAMKARIVTSSIFMNVSLQIFIFGFHQMNFKWVFFAFSTLLLPNFTLIVELLCKLLAFYVNSFHCLLVWEFSFTFIALSLVNPSWLPLISW